MTSLKLSVRIVSIAVMAAAFAASCAQLLGDLEVVGGEEQGTGSLFPDAGPSAPEVICELGTTQCDGRLLQLCTDGGTAWVTLQACATEALCESNGLSTVSACIRPSCAAEEMSCEGSLLRICNKDRTGWDEFDECDSPAHCNAGNRRCEPSPCVAGERRCNTGNLERCQDDRLDWEPLDTCATNELCVATLEAAAADLIGSGSADVSGDDPEGSALVVEVSECLLPPCVEGEVRCEGAQLDICNEGRTSFEPLELCATDVLCQNTLTYVGLGGRPRCRQAVCDVDQHQCTPSGILQVCTPGREGYRTIETCVGPPFCNAALADSGGSGCTDAACAPGQTQCNGAQIQRCLPDRTGFENVGAPCETRDLCNDDDPANVLCNPPVCQRGQFSATEFRCQGATLQRCNDQHTGYETIDTCDSAGLCNAGLGLLGCQAPACDPGETRCNGDFLQICNGQRTGFEDLERCAAGTCDGTAGRCADPCVVGTARCNAQGEVEECRNRLVGREVTARCISPQLCDAANRSCRQPPAGCTADGVRRCRQQGTDTLLEVCSDGRSRFALLDTCGAGEFCDVNNERCDVCNQASQPTCEGNVLVTCAANGQTVNRTTCDQGCQVVANGPDRCRTCAIGSARCEGPQLVVCEQGATGEILAREACDSSALCQQTLVNCNSGQGGAECQCQPGACRVGEVDCNDRQPLICNADRTAMVPNGAPCIETGCDEDTGTCNFCQTGFTECRSGVMFACFDNSRFETILAANRERCLSPQGPEQSCTGNTLNAPVECPNDLCLNGTGCVECIEEGFRPVCQTTPQGQGRTQCLNGEIEAIACPGASDPCVTVGCTNGVCGTPQPRCTGALPFCVGNGTCVQCTQNGHCLTGEVCSNNICVPAPCTQDRCVAGNIQVCQANGSLAAATPCPFPGVCNSAGTACQACNAQRDCAAPDACTPPQCLGTTGCVTQSACTQGQVCEGRGANAQCVNLPACGDGSCNGSDDTRNCPEDCGTECGDGECNGEESTQNCVADCGTRCGDGVANGSEVCDGRDLKGVPGCAANETGSVTCNAACSAIVRACEPVPACGDGEINTPAEVCDNEDLGNQSCQTQGFDRGTLACSAQCSAFNTSGCSSCGDRVVNAPAEACDGAAGVPATCGEGQQGQVVCNAQCQLDRSGCSAVPRCGDGVVNTPNEACDGSAGVPASCGDDQEGRVVCSPNCQLDRSGCRPLPRCGDGNCNGNEATTNCPADCGSRCGDGVVNGAEECEGAQTQEITCADESVVTRVCQECRFAGACPVVSVPGVPTPNLPVAPN